MRRGIIRPQPWQVRRAPALIHNLHSMSTPIRQRLLHSQSSTQSPASSSSRGTQMHQDYDRSWPGDFKDLPLPPQRRRASTIPESSTRLDELIKLHEQFIPEDDGANVNADVDTDADADYDLAATAFDQRPLEQDPPPLPTYEESLKKSRKKRRVATAEPITEPLPPGTVPEDGKTRFDWRGKSLSRTRHALGKEWYPDAWRTRVPPPHTKLSEIEPLFLELQRYSEHFLPLLVAEEEEAERQFMQRLKEWPDDKLKREGFMLDRMGASTDWKPNYDIHGVAVTFTKIGSEATQGLPNHQFEAGQTVLLSRTDPLVDAVVDPTSAAGAMLKGTVLHNARGLVRVTFLSVPDDIRKGLWRIDIGNNDFAFKRQREALTKLNLDPVAQDMLEFSQRPWRPSKPKSIEDEALDAVLRRPNKEQKILTGTGLRDLLLRRFQTDYHPIDSGPANISEREGDEDGISAETVEMKPSDVEATASPSLHHEGPRGILTRNKLIDSWTRRYRTSDDKEPLVVEGDPEVPLNPSQMRAIAMMLSERLSLVQGPPGTGKTRVIVETIKLLKKHWQIPHPILVCAHTNVAVDNLLEGLRKHGLKPLRYGNIERVPESLHDRSFDTLLQEHPTYEEIQAITRERQAVKDMLGSNTTMSASAREAKQKYSTSLNAKAFMMRRRMFFDVLNNADVICTTCLSATSRVLEAIDFPFVFLDEASMATEPLSIVPLTKGSAQVAIIGDHKQLPPVIVSETAQAGGLGTSLFERLIHEGNVPSIMLDTQYRMHPSISAFSSTTFYNDALRDGTVLPDGSIRPGLEPPVTDFLRSSIDPTERPNVTFLNHNFPESPTNRSIANYHEAGRVCDIVADLLERNPDLKGTDIGVIAPYTAQIRTINEYLTLDADRQAAFHSWLGDRAAEVADIEVKTVDGFEGREKQVIIFSTVRSNSQGYIGFLADWRRLNVGITRAKRGLIMLGSVKTLSDARIGAQAADAMPRDGVRVWRSFMRYLRERGLIMEDPA